MPLRHVLIAALVAAALALASGGCGPAGPEGVAIVSGRDDHGLLERPAIGLQRSPSDTSVVATAHDGEFAYVLKRSGLFAYIRLVASGEEGWIADHDLRGEGIRTDPAPPRRVVFVAAEKREGEPWVKVRYTTDASEEWLRASVVREVAAR